MAIGVELILIAGLIALNGVFALAEIAIVSARKTKLQQLARDGSQRAQVALEVASSPNAFLSTIQIGITLIAVLAGAIGGSALARPLASQLAALPFIAGFATPIAFGMVVLVITYLTLILGELLPKKMALVDAERMASALAVPMRRLARVFSPLVRVLAFSTEGIARILGIKETAHHVVTEEEVKIMIEQGAQAGIFDKAEETIMKNVLRLGDKNAGDLMTARMQMVALDASDPLEEHLQTILRLPYSFYPVYEGDQDNVVGVLSVEDLFIRRAAGQPLTISSLLKRPLIVAESMPALKVLEVFKKSGWRFAVVIDEHGGVAGIITLTDVFEAVVGGLAPDDAQALPEFSEDAPSGRWLVDGMVRFDEFRERFDFTHLEDEDSVHYHTLAGFMVKRFGHIPSVGETCEWHSIAFEVAAMEGRRIAKVLVRLPETAEAPYPSGV